MLGAYAAIRGVDPEDERLVAKMEDNLKTSENEGRTNDSCIKNYIPFIKSMAVPSNAKLVDILSSKGRLFDGHIRCVSDMFDPCCTFKISDSMLGQWLLSKDLHSI
eukprot:gnl/TRDRNA2_/TRDRNA2_177171_c0_seq1.p1 gnl/TRDRNA2_/TRDRNA2_177171_c0~~gnl/TRDRNA2_/TRDRNA2_177171_c0_seq1.p1  ORF type:complete len:106 (-),score=14.58 gnl/TRDRNA2_/TRDRNA2_177171_c0_seq1:531-848(-)